jgi:hypothetical protein
VKDGSASAAAGNAEMTRNGRTDDSRLPAWEVLLVIEFPRGGVCGRTTPFREGAPLAIITKKAAFHARRRKIPTPHGGRPKKG